MTERYASLLESLAVDDSDSRISNRRAIAVAYKRAQDRFGAFLDAANSASERTARLNVVRSDLKEVVSSTCSEYGGDPNKIEASILRRWTAGTDKPLNDEEEESIKREYFGENAQDLLDDPPVHHDKDKKSNLVKEAPGNKHLPGASDKRNRQYEHIKDSYEESGDSEEESKELAARTVNKQRAEHGETKQGAGEGVDSHGGLSGLPEEIGEGGQESFDPMNPKVEKSISLEPNWEGLRAWVLALAKTDPEHAKEIAKNMGHEAPPELLYQDEQQGGPEPHPADYPQDQESPGVEMGGEAGPYQASVHEARRPKMCPYHNEVTDISLATGDPAAGFNTMSQHAWGPQHCQGEYDGRCNFKREMVTQSYWDQKAEQAQERREQREQLLQQQPQVPDALPEEMPVEEGIDGELSEAPSAVGDGEPVEESAEALAPMAAHRQAGPFDGIINDVAQMGAGDAGLPQPPVTPPTATPPNPAAGMAGGAGLAQGINPLLNQLQQKIQPQAPQAPVLGPGVGVNPMQPSGPTGQGPHQQPGPYAGGHPGIGGGAPGGALGDAAHAMGVNPSMMNKLIGSQHQAEADRDGGGAVKTEELPAANKDGLSKQPSGPEMDSTKWKPNALFPNGNLPPVDTQMSGSPVPNADIDINKPIPADRSDSFLDGTDSVTDTVDLPSDDSNAGFTTEKNQTDSGPTKTWTENNGASPVTTEVQSAKKVDPDKNPIRQILEEKFVAPAQVQAAITEFESK